MATRLFLNIDRESPDSARVASLLSDAFVPPPSRVRADDSTFEIHFLRRSSSGNRAFDYYDPAGKTVRLAIGRLNQVPDSGTWTLTDPAAAETTGALAHDITDAALQTAIRAALSTNYSAATVTSNGPGDYAITRGTVGAITEITGDATALDPGGSNISIYTTQAGTASLSARYAIQLRKAAAAGRFDAWSPLPTAAVTITQVQTGSASANSIQQVQWNPDAYAGSVALTWQGATATQTILVPYNTSAADFETALEAHTDIAANTVSVTLQATGDYLIEFVGALGLAARNAITSAANTLQVPVGVTGKVTTNTPGFFDLLGSDDTANALLEVELIDGGSPLTVYQTTIQLIADLIPNVPSASGPLPTWLSQSDIATTEDAESGTGTGVMTSELTAAAIDAQAFEKLYPPILVAGAGSAEVNGVYLPVAKNGDRAVYKSATHTMGYSTTFWYIEDDLTQTIWYTAISSALTPDLVTSWAETIDSDSPAPTVTVTTLPNDLILESRDGKWFAGRTLAHWWTDILAAAVTFAVGVRVGSGAINAQTGTSYTLLAADNGKIITLTNAAAITLTVPAGLDVGFSCAIIQGGAGQVTITPSSTTVNSFGGALKLAGQHASATLFSTASNVFSASGNLST